jgi:hypothetical protein
MGTAGEAEGKCAGLLVSELSLACSVFLQIFLLHCYVHARYILHATRCEL